MPGVEARVARLLELLGCDLADVAEEVCGEGPLPVVASEHPLHAHAREARLVLAQVIDLVDREALLQDDGPARRRAAATPQGPAELPHGHVRDRGELLELAGALPPRRGEVLRRDLDRELGPVVDQDLAVPVEDVAAGGLNADLTDPVVVGLVPVLVAGENLDVPEPQEEDGEDRDGEAGDDRDPEGERGRSPLGLDLISTQIHQAQPLSTGRGAAVRRAARRSSTTAERTTSLTIQRTGRARRAPSRLLTRASRTTRKLTFASMPVPIWIAAITTAPRRVREPPSRTTAARVGRPSVSR